MPCRQAQWLTRRAVLSLAGRAVLAGGALEALSGRGHAASPPKQVTLVMWTHFAGKTLAVMKGLIKEFEQQNPDIRLDITPFGVNEIDTKFLASVAAGAPPDIYHAPGRIAPEIPLGGALTPLDDFVKFPRDLLQNFGPYIVHRGKRYGMPANGGLGAMAYDAALLEQAGGDPRKLPATWDELMAVAEKMTKPGQGRWGVVFANAPVVVTAQHIMYSLFLEAGAEYTTPDGAKPAFNSAAGLGAFQFATDLVQKWNVSPVKAYGMVDTWNEFGTGNLGAINLYPVWLANIKAYKFRTVTGPMPTRKQRATHFAGNYFTLSSKSTKREAFARFVEWWARPENNSRWCIRSGGIPISHGVLNSPTYQDYMTQEPLIRAYIESIPFAHPTPAVVGITGVMQVLAEAWNASVLGRMKPKAALDQADKRAAEELKRAQREFKAK